jgi:hypothetical protein
MAIEHERDGESAAAIVSWRPRLEGMCTSMRISLFASNAALAEYFVIALGMADHTVTLYSAVQDLVSALAAAASLQGEAPHEVLLLELILDASGRQLLADLSGLAKEVGMPIIVLTTTGRDAIDLAQAAFPEACLRQLPLPPRALFALIQLLGPHEVESGSQYR